MATSKMVLTLLDRDGEAATISVRGTTLTAGNIATQTGLADTLRDAILAVSKGVLSKDSRIASETGFSPVLPTHVYAQRGIKWLVRARDTNGNSVTFHIPVADMEVTDILDGENMDLTTTEGAALVNAIEAYVKSNDGEAVTVQEIVYID